MKLSGQVKSISHLKAHAPDMIRKAREARAPFVITQNGEATAILQDIESYEEAQQAMAFLKLVATGKADADAGRGKPFRKAFRDIRRDKLSTTR